MPSDNVEPGSRQRWSKLALVVLALVGIPTVFESGCYYHSCYDDDDFDDNDHCDDHDHDDHHHATNSGASLGPPSATLSLDGFEQIATSKAGAHPVAAVVGIAGFNIFQHLKDLLGPGRTFGPPEFELYTTRLIQANRELLTVPAAVGVVLFERAEFLSTGIHVRYCQYATAADDRLERLQGTGLRFHFNTVGDLLAVDIRTWLDPSQRD